jgi:hypothetical protein
MSYIYKWFKNLYLTSNFNKLGDDGYKAFEKLETLMVCSLLIILLIIIYFIFLNNGRS